jgi:hypothetical protein
MDGYVYYGSIQTFSTSTIWEAVDTKVYVLVKNNGAYYTAINFALAFSTSTPPCITSQTSYHEVSLEPNEFQVKEITFSAAEIQTLINNGWNTATTRGLWIVGQPQTYRDERILGSVNENSYPDGAHYEVLLPDMCLGNTPAVSIDDIFMEVFESGYAVDITYPQNASSTADFQNWGLSFHFNTPVNDAWAMIDWGMNPNNLNHLDIASWHWVDAITSATGLVWKADFLPSTAIGTIYYAQASLYATSTMDLDLTPDATSSVIWFFYQSGPMIWNTSPTSTASSTEWVMTCDESSNLFTQSLCYLLQYLFQPSANSLNQFNNLITSVENKPPIGYFYAVKNALSGLNASGTPAFVLENASSTLNTPIFTPLKTGIGWILWLFFGFWVFNRIRHFYI